jgi:lipoprotein NlpD
VAEAVQKAAAAETARQQVLLETAKKLATERAALEAEQKFVLERAAPQPVMAASMAAAPASAASATTSTPPVSTDDDIAWIWPTDGPVLAGFDEVKMKGLDIGGTAGASILAAADGRAVYVGAGLRGYGNLIILKHNNTYLTAYAHNQTLLVKEGQLVRKGQKIAEMGSSDADRVKLSFELRRHGKPVDPSKYLPPR